MKLVTYNEIEEAYDRIKDYANKTPVMSSRTLNEQLNCEVFFKCENLQRVGAFKFRGAFNAISQLPKEQLQNGIICHSSGNHAQAVALSGKLLGIKAVIVMPKNSPQVKVNATRDTYEGEVVFCENNVQARHETTQKLIDEHGYTMIHPFDNHNIICGAGTACYELLQEYPDLDTIVGPVGGGGLISGTSTAAKGYSSKIKVYAIEPERANDAYRSFQSGEIKTNTNPDTIADGLLTNLSERTFAHIQKHVDEIITVSEPQILRAMKHLWERMKLVVEPSGAVPLAGIQSGKFPIKGKKIGVIISGGNLDLTPMFDAVENMIVPEAK